jgi:hypothetical protein
MAIAVRWDRSSILLRSRINAIGGTGAYVSSFPMEFFQSVDFALK